jgi:hypothetical protein
VSAGIARACFFDNQYVSAAYFDSCLRLAIDMLAVLDRVPSNIASSKDAHGSDKAQVEQSAPSTLLWMFLSEGGSSRQPGSDPFSHEQGMQCMTLFHRNSFRK